MHVDRRARGDSFRSSAHAGPVQAQKSLLHRVLALPSLTLTLTLIRYAMANAEGRSSSNSSYVIAQPSPCRSPPASSDTAAASQARA